MSNNQLMRIKYLGFLIVLLHCSAAQGQDPFVTSWNITDDFRTITIPTIGNGYNYSVDWGDGTSTGGHTGDATHTYFSSDTFEVSISGDFPRIYFNADVSSRGRIISIDQWGNNVWTSMNGAFAGCVNLQVPAVDTPNLSMVTDMRSMFSTTFFTYPVLNHWDVSNVELMDSMFFQSYSFDAPIGAWEVGNVTSMKSMFQEARAFDQDLDAWDVSSVTDMSYLFNNAWQYNQDLASWNVAQVTDMSNMFESAGYFNQPIGTWDVSNVRNMHSLFNGASTFDQDISSWDVALVKDMSEMFRVAYAFNQDISSWSVDSVTNMQAMFHTATQFNQDIGMWVVGNVTNMNSMFKGAVAFDQNLGNWNISIVNDMSDMFDGAALSIINYDALLAGWNNNGPSNTIDFDAGLSMYCNATAARDSLIQQFGWTISDRGSCSLRPSNDDVASAIELLVDSLPNVGDNTYATGQNGETQGDCLGSLFGNVQTSVWYKFVAPSSGMATVTTDFANTSLHNSQITVYAAPSDSTNILTLGAIVGCSKDDGIAGPDGRTAVSEINDLNPGEQYYVQVNGASTLVGQFMIQVLNGTSCIKPSANLIDTIKLCPTNQFLLNINVSDVGSAVDLTIRNDQDLPSIAYVDTGQYQVGPFDIGNDVELEIINSLDSTCFQTITINNLDSCQIVSDTFFITTWQTTTANEEIIIPTKGSGYNYAVDWGDGIVSTNQTTDATHTYANPGYYTVKISGDFPRIYFFNSVHSQKIKFINQWGNNAWTTMDSAFYSCGHLTSVASDVPNLDSVSSLNSMFAFASEFNQPINDWDVSAIVDMRAMFYRAASFDQNLGNWNISQVMMMDSMFYGVRLKEEKYDSTLISWSTQPVQSGVQFHGGSSIYCEADSQRMELINQKGWTITDGGKCQPFITTWKTQFANQSISIPTKGSGYHYTVDWGDGTITTNHTGSTSHTYADAGNHVISISGDFPRILFSASENKEQLIQVNQWGSQKWTTMAQAFESCSNLVLVATDAPDLSACVSLSSAFSGIKGIDQDINAWNVSSIRDMSFAFSGVFTFNNNIGDWDVSNVVNMEGMFSTCLQFNQDISGWNVQKVIDMSDMFSFAEAFNQNIGQWNVASVRDMSQMFLGAKNFNQNINSWDVSQVRNMHRLFSSANNFNQPLDAWNVSAVNDMSFMFSSAVSFDQPLGNWDVSQVRDMTGMFSSALVFNQPIGMWNVSNVYAMGDTLNNTDGMFAFAASFNQDIGSWNTANVSNMASMFKNAISFNQNISSWNTGLVTNMSEMFFNAIAFDQPIGTWAVDNVTDMNYMFADAATFNQDINSWNVGSVTDMRGMFSHASMFNQNIGSWNVSNVKNMNGMFQSAIAFDQAIGGWDVAAVKDMGLLFAGAQSFNQPLTSWHVSNTTSMKNMFSSASSFNQDISAWNVSMVTEMQFMFRSAAAFNQDLSAWNVSNVTNMEGMFTNALVFDQNIGGWNIENLTNASNMFFGATLSTMNYDSLLIGWNNQTVNENINFQGGYSTYCAGSAARDQLINQSSWVITDGGSDFSACRNSEFITTWRTVLPNETITIPTIGSGYNYTVDWGDGTISNGLTSNAMHTYLSPGDHTIFISGDFPRVFFNNQGDKEKIVSIDQWGDQAWTSMEHAFSGCTNLILVAIDTPNLGLVSNMQSMFSRVTMFDRDIGHWDVSGITAMDSMFHEVSIPTTAYDSLLIKWSNQNLQPNVTFDAGRSIYCAGAAARDSLLINNNWTITDGGICRDFITTWRTTVPNETILIPTSPLNHDDTYDYSVDWGDGTITTNHSGDASHSYATPGDYSVSISGHFPAIYFSNPTANHEKIISVDQWGTQQWKSMVFAFSNCSNLIINAADVPDLSKLTNVTAMFQGVDSIGPAIVDWDVSTISFFSSMFNNVSSFNQDIGGWDVSAARDMSSMLSGTGFNQDISSWDVSFVTDMSRLFSNATSFNQNISGWDVSRVTNMSSMFSGADSFDQPIGNWNVERVKTMYAMFFENDGFNQPIGNWSVDSVETMQEMFSGATSFNQNIDNWNTSRVTSMRSMFSGATSFNQPLNSWDVGNVRNMFSMFSGATSFDQPIGNWNIQLVNNLELMFRDAASFNQDISGWHFPFVTSFRELFSGATSFNQPLNSWDVSNVNDMTRTFFRAASFNQPLDSLDVSSVTDMYFMFGGAARFNQDISSWDVSNVTDMVEMFSSALSFDQNIGSWDVSAVNSMNNMFLDATLSTANYDSLLINWSQLDLKPNVQFHAGNSSYCAGAAERASIISNKNWSIQDMGECQVSPSNDDLAQAILILIDNPPVVGNNSAATRQVDEIGGSCWGQTIPLNSVWYKFQAPPLGIATITTDFPFMDLHDTHITVFEAPSDSLDMTTIGQEVGCSEDDGDALPLGYSSIVRLDNLNPGELYYVQVDGGNTAGYGGVGEFQIQVLGCNSPMFSLREGSNNCPVPEYFIEVEINDLGSANLVNIINNGGAPTIMNVDTGTYSIGPFALSDTIDVQVVDTASIACRSIASFVIPNNCISKDDFVFTWNTFSDNQTLTIPTTGTGYNYAVDWGDGTITTNHTGNASHTYAVRDTYQVVVIGDFPRIYVNFSSTRSKLLSIDQWGTGEWTSMKNAFYGCFDLRVLAVDTPNLSQVSDMSGMFRSCSKLDDDISGWDVSNVTDMSNLFNGARRFNQDLNSWNVDSVQNMSNMFNNCQAFNGDIGDWQVGNVTDMNRMFSFAKVFNQDISNWDVGQVSTMQSMFSNCDSFNQAIGTWDVSHVSDMSFMFQSARSFNEDINNWSVDSVSNMQSMFQQASSFNQNLDQWNFPKVTSMANLFNGASAFNGSIGSWDVGNVTDMGGMFENAHAFNQDIGGWNVGNVTIMWNMFERAYSFNQDIGGWDVSNVAYMLDMFREASAFDQNIGQWDVSNVQSFFAMFADASLSTHNYDSLLIGWSARTLRSGVGFQAGSSQYCGGLAARQAIMDNYGWFFFDLGLDSACIYLPDCISSLSIANGSTDVSVFEPLSWSADGVADYYVINAGYSPGATELLNGISVGADTFYNAIQWPFDSTIFVEILAVDSVYGSPANCSVDSFTTERFLPCKIVYNMLDSAAGSLSYAVGCVESGDTITFWPHLENDTIPGIVGPLAINTDVSIVADTSKHLYLSGELQSTALIISSGAAVNINGLNIIASDQPSGRVIENNGNLTLNNVKLLQASSAQNGVEIISTGELLIDKNCEIGDTND